MSIPKGTLFDTHKVRFNVVKSALKEIECTQTDSDNTARIIWWDGFMHRDQLLNMYPHQRINRIPGMDQICYKSNTFMAMNRLRKIDRDLFNFFPLTYILPNEYPQFKNEAEKMLKKSEEQKVDQPTWIFKPRSGQCGIGIQLFQDPSTVADAQKYIGIVQSYIAPHLVNGIKFDLRLYLFVSTIQPYTIYLYHEGLSRFCTEPYVKPSSENLNDLFMHLTNTSVNIKNQNADKSSYIQFASPVLEKLNKPNIWKKIKRVAALSMVAQYHQIIENIEQEEVILADSNEHFKAALKAKSKKDEDNEEDNKDIVDLPPVEKFHRYFHLAGIDILINDKYEPILLEMNDRPSMFVSFEEIERELKKNLVKEALSLISLDGSPVNKDSYGKWEKIFPDPEDEVFNKKALEIMNKSLRKPISDFHAVKIQQPPKVKETKARNPPQNASSQVQKKNLQAEQVISSQHSKRPVQQDQEVVHQFSKTLRPSEQSSMNQLTRKVQKADLNATMQLPKKSAQNEQAVKESKAKKVVQQKKEEASHQPRTKHIEKSSDQIQNISSTEDIHRPQSKRTKQQNISPEKPALRPTHSSKNYTAKDLRMSSSTYLEDQGVRRSYDRVSIPSDGSPTAKRIKNPTQASNVKHVNSAKRKASNTAKVESITGVSSGETLPPLSSPNKESPKAGKNTEHSTLSSLPVINQINCQ